MRELFRRLEQTLRAVTADGRCAGAVGKQALVPVAVRVHDRGYRLP